MIQNNLIHEGERLDELQRNGYGIIQNPARFCFGMDAVLLSGFAKAKAGEKVLDLGTGTGIIPILMEAKTDAADFTALEIQEESADMARRSVAYNHLEDKIKVITGDIRDASNIFGASSFHVITTNPPYMIGTHGENSPSTAKAIARHEVLCTLDDILRESAKMLMPGGRFYMVHRPFRLAEIMSKMVEYKIEPKRSASIACSIKLFFVLSSSGSGIPLISRKIFINSFPVIVSCSYRYSEILSNDSRFSIRSCIASS